MTGSMTELKTLADWRRSTPKDSAEMNTLLGEIKSMQERNKDRFAYENLGYLVFNVPADFRNTQISSKGGEMILVTDFSLTLTSEEQKLVVTYGSRDFVFAFNGPVEVEIIHLSAHGKETKKYCLPPENIPDSLHNVRMFTTGEYHTTTLFDADGNLLMPRSVHLDLSADLPAGKKQARCRLSFDWESWRRGTWKKAPEQSEGRPLVELDWGPEGNAPKLNL